MVSVVDCGIIAGYLVLMLVVGYFSGKENKTQSDYFLAGRSMPWVPIALSVAATMISANGFIGGPGWAYTSGMYPVMVNIAVPFAVFIALSITTPVIYRMNVTSVYEYMGKRLGKYSKALSIIQFFINSIIQISSMVYIPVLILKMITGWSFYILVPLVVVTALAYTLMGGIKAVIWTDSIQMIVVVGAVFLVIYTAIRGSGLGFMDTVSMAQKAGKLNALNFSTDITAENTFWATLIGGSMMWIRYFCFDQAQVQRVLTSKSLKSAKNSFVVSAFVMNIVYYIMLFVGVILFVYYKGRTFETSNEIMISFILNEMPVGAVGLIIAGVFAAAMSSVDSLLNSMTAVFTKDVYEPFVCTKKKEEASLKVTMIITLVIGMIMMLVIFIGFNGTVKSILDVVGNYISYFAGPAAGIFLLAMFTYTANDLGTAAGFLAGLFGGYAVAVKCQVSWLWNPAIGATITVVCGYVFSMISKRKNQEEKAAEYTAMGIRKRLLEDGKHREDGISVLPFSVGRHEAAVLLFFVLQYVVLYFIQY